MQSLVPCLTSERSRTWPRQVVQPWCDHVINLKGAFVIIDWGLSSLMLHGAARAPSWAQRILLCAQILYRYAVQTENSYHWKLLRSPCIELAILNKQQQHNRPW